MKCPECGSTDFAITKRVVETWTDGFTLTGDDENWSVSTRELPNDRCIYEETITCCECDWEDTKVWDQ